MQFYIEGDCWTLQANEQFMKYWHVTLIVSVFLTVFTNNTFWANVISRLDGTSDVLFLISFFLVLILITNILLNLVSFSRLLKPIVIFILMTSASAAYFMDEFSTMIDKEMIINVLESDLRESSEFFNVAFVVKLLLLGAIPAYLIFRIPIIYPSNFWRGVWQRSLVLLLSLAAAVLIIFSQYQNFSGFGRANRDLRHFINPENYLFSLKSLAVQTMGTANVIAKPIGTDALLNRGLEERDKPTLVVLVLVKQHELPIFL